MSDAQLPPEIGEGEDDPALRSAVPPADAGVKAAVRLEALNGDRFTSLPDSGSDRGPDDRAVQASAPAPGEHDMTSEAAFDDVQPMLDLRFPDASPQVLAPDEAQPFTLEPIDQDFPAEPPALLDVAGFDQQRHLDAGEEAAETEPPVEVSPIFSALDAAERDAQVVQREAVAQLHPYATDILLPRFELADEAEDSVAPAVLLPASEPQAIDTREDDSHFSAASTIEAAAAPELPPQNDSGAPEAEERMPPAEALSDDAAARIAAEASATAAALENLKRLLVHKLPEPNVVPAPNPPDTLRERLEPPPIPAYRPAVQLPVSPPPMVAAPATGTSLSFADYDDAPPRRWLSVGSFFAGFVLSWVLGAVLYVFLTS